jgi:hypothetical protein
MVDFFDLQEVCKGKSIVRYSSGRAWGVFLFSVSHFCPNNSIDGKSPVMGREYVVNG